MARQEHLQPIQIDRTVHKYLKEYCEIHRIYIRTFIEDLICNKIGLVTDNQEEKEIKDVNSNS